MLLTIDIGNTSTSFMVFDEDVVVGSKRIKTEKFNEMSYDENIINALNEDVDAIVISCVVPDMCMVIRDACSTRWPNARIFNVSQEHVSSFVSALEVPQDIGADFIATSMAAYDFYRKAVCVVDIGSATKITYTNDLGVFQGGAIIPGLDSSIRGLVEYIPHLPMVAKEFPNGVIGNSTESAIQSGLMYGLVAQICGFVSLIEKEVGTNPTWVLTGGYSHLFRDHLPEFQFHDQLLHMGLKLMYQKELFI